MTVAAAARKARFSELVDDAVEKGPQIVTRRGIDTAVVVSSTNGAALSLPASTLRTCCSARPRFDIPLPKRAPENGASRWCLIERFLLDTNVVSETRRFAPQSSASWLKSSMLRISLFRSRGCRITIWRRSLPDARPG